MCTHAYAALGNDIPGVVFLFTAPPEAMCIPLLLEANDNIQYITVRRERTHAYTTANQIHKQARENMLHVHTSHTAHAGHIA